MKFPGFKEKFKFRKHPIPLVDFSGWLKTHQPTDRDEIGALLFDHCFPDFFPSDEIPEMDTIQKASLDEAERMGFETLDTSTTNNRRRYAGDWEAMQFLGRGCYSSVCMDQEGDDGGTLINELNAYTAPVKNGFTLASYVVTDGVVDPSRIAVFLCDTEAFPSRGIAVGCEAGLMEPETHRARFELGTTTSWREINNVFDLRQPAARDWLFEFAKGDDDWLSYQGHPLPKSAGFFGLLPTLMDRKVGGNLFTEQIAGFLRNQGVSAMIYPSARSNVEVHWQGGELQGFSGWSLVDWSDSEPPPKRTVSWVTDWNPPLEGQIAVSGPPANSEFRGSFRVEGNEENEFYLRHLAMVMSLAEGKADSGWFTGYRWHAGRIISDGPSFHARCIACSQEFDCGNELMALPNQCPECGNDELVLP